MKWPEWLAWIRHAETAYNELKKKKAEDPDYQRFVAAYDKDWKSHETQELAHMMWMRYQLDCGDWNTPLTPLGTEQATALGLALPQVLELPDVVFISPHDRTRRTYELAVMGWPELAEVKLVEEPRLHEQDHGLSIVYNDWRIFFALNSLQKLLYDQQGPYWYRFPQGENVPDIIERKRSFIGTLVRDYSEKKVLVFSHHLSLLGFMAAIGRWDQYTFLDWDDNKKPINCGLTLYRGNPKMGAEGKLELVDYNKKLY